MNNILNLIKEKNLMSPDEIIGVAVSGGKDSMAMLHFLNAHKNELNIDIIALNVDHSIRLESARDSKFVKDYCEEHDIKFYKFKIDVPEMLVNAKYTLEEAAREARYGIFQNAVERGLVSKVAIAHHLSDQAETILLHILRGSGLSGASGMEYIRDNIYIRPMLDTSKKEIEKYIKENNVPFVEDATNADCTYARNYIRNTVLPLIKERWENAESTLSNFGKICREDDEYIKKQNSFNSIIYENNIAKIPLNYFIYESAVIKRMLFGVIKKLGVSEDIEYKHINLIIKLATEGESGSKIDLPMGLKAHKEYTYLTIIKSQRVVKSYLKVSPVYAFKIGTLVFENYGEIVAEKSSKTTISENLHTIDANKLPSGAVWRTKKTGDYIQPLGITGTKKLKDYLMDKKIPLRVRDSLPVLACDNIVYAVADVGISDLVKVDDNTQSVYQISYIKK